MDAPRPIDVQSLLSTNPLLLGRLVTSQIKKREEFCPESVRAYGSDQDSSSIRAPVLVALLSRP
jgi:hypothetical protein